MAKSTLKVLRRISVDFIVTDEEDTRIASKYVSLLDKEGKEITSSDLYFIGYETENGDECDEDGELL